MSGFELIDRFPGIRSEGRHFRQKKPRVEKYMQIICYDVNLELVLFEGAAGDKASRMMVRVQMKKGMVCKAKN